MATIFFQWLAAILVIFAAVGPATCQHRKLTIKRAAHSRRPRCVFLFNYFLFHFIGAIKGTHQRRIQKPFSSPRPTKTTILFLFHGEWDNFRYDPTTNYTLDCIINNQRLSLLSNLQQIIVIVKLSIGFHHNLINAELKHKFDNSSPKLPDFQPEGKNFLCIFTRIKSLNSFATSVAENWA